MKKIIAAIALIMTPTVAMAQDFPGSAWVNVTGPNLGVEEGNWVLSGKINQDAVITDVSDWKLSAYTNVAFSVDTKGFDWNNKVTPAAGVKFSKQMDNGVFDVGVQYSHETRFGSQYRVPQRSQGGVQVSVNYWTGWGR